VEGMEKLVAFVGIPTFMNVQAYLSAISSIFLSFGLETLATIVSSFQPLQTSGSERARLLPAGAFGVPK